MDEFDIPDEITEESKIKKWVILAIGIFLMFLMVSYSFLNYGIDDYVAGMFASSQVIDNKIIFENGVIIFNGNSYNDLTEKFLASDGAEFKACLLGAKEGKKYSIEQVIFPVVFEQTYRSVLAEPCPAGAVAELHSHPFKRCIASFHDIQNHRRLQLANPGTLMIVMCNIDRMNVYS